LNERRPRRVRGRGICELVQHRQGLALKR
jgi:hypothetical protein